MQADAALCMREKENPFPNARGYKRMLRKKRVEGKGPVWSIWSRGATDSGVSSFPPK